MDTVSAGRVRSRSSHPRGCVDLGAPSSTSSSQAARPSPCPQGVHRLGGELTTTKAAVNVQGVEGTQAGTDEVTKLAACSFGL